MATLRPIHSDVTVGSCLPQSGNRRLRVVHCIAGFGVGGTELNAVRTLEKLDRNRFELFLISLNEDGPLRKRVEEAQIPIHCFSISNLYGFGSVRRAKQLVSWMKLIRPDIVHCHDRYTNIFVTPCARLAGTPFVITSRRWWTAMLRPGHAMANRCSYWLSDVVIANSQRVADLVVGEGVAASKVAVVTNFVDDAAFDPIDPQLRRVLRESLGIPFDALLGCIVANLRPEKDHISLLRALKQLSGCVPEIHLLLVGMGPCESELKAACGELGIADRVHFAGYLRNPPNPHHFGDFSVLCSLHEGFPNSVIEAMAAARPVIATSVGGIPDAVDDGVTGILVPPSAPGELAAAMKTLRDTKIREYLGQAGRRRAQTEFPADAVLRSLSELYVNGADYPPK